MIQQRIDIMRRLSERLTLPKLISLLRLRNAFPFAIGAGMVGAATIVCFTVASILRSSDLTLIYLVAVVLAARNYGLWTSVFVSVSCILAWDYFFTRPAFSLYMSDERDVFTLTIFMIVSLLVSAMTSHIRYQNKQLGQLAANKTQLYAFSEKLVAMKTNDEIADFTASYAKAKLKRNIVLLLENRAARNPNLVFPASAAGVDNGRLARLDLAAELNGSESEAPSARRDLMYIPVVALRGRIGAVIIEGTRAAPVSSEDKQHITTILGQAATAIERIWLEEERETSNLAAETERVRSALLISVSHDLRTPLTSIIGSLTTLETMTEQDRISNKQELTDIALSEALRLDRFIGNLLDMTKLEFGGLDVKLAPIKAEHIVEAALQRSEKLLQGHSVAVHVQHSLPSANANSELLEQALFNIIDNAAKYSPANGEIEIRCFSEDARIAIQVLDRGEGISNQLSKIIFQKFARSAQGDSKPPGTGLGLVIAKGFLEAMGGEITAENRPGGSGAIFTLWLSANAPAPASGEVG